MTQTYPKHSLDLLFPGDLPIEQELNNSDQEKLSQIVTKFLQVFKQPSSEKELIILEEILVCLRSIEVVYCEIPSTQSYLENWEIFDYDQYFNVMRIKSSKQAFSLLKGIVTAYHSIVLVECENKQLNSPQIELQKKGFISYAKLLMRVCDLPITSPDMSPI